MWDIMRKPNKGPHFDGKIQDSNNEGVRYVRRERGGSWTGYCCAQLGLGSFGRFLRNHIDWLRAEEHLFVTLSPNPQGLPPGLLRLPHFRAASRWDVQTVPGQQSPERLRPCFMWDTDCPLRVCGPQWPTSGCWRQRANRRSWTLTAFKKNANKAEALVTILTTHGSRGMRWGWQQGNRLNVCGSRACKPCTSFPSPSAQTAPPPPAWRLTAPSQGPQWGQN